VSRAEVYRNLLDGRAPIEAIDKLAGYASELERWSQKQSLVRFSSPEELIHRHILESLEALPLLQKEGRLLDIGSGAGLPGIPLLCALPGFSGVLLEPRAKRWAFLRHIIRELGLKAEARRESFQDHRDGDYSLVTSRALGGHEDMALWSREHLRSDGRVLFWATEREEKVLRGLSGWNVLGSPIAGLARGRLILMKECFT